MKKWIVILVLFNLGMAHADDKAKSKPSWDGNSIATPALSDYHAGSRSPGILHEPTGIFSLK